MKTYFYFIFILLIGCTTSEDNDQSQQDAASEISLSKDQMAQFNFTTVKLEKRVVEKQTMCMGMIDVPPQGNFVFTAIAGGRITDIQYYPGQKVKKGALICRIENPAFIEKQQAYFSTINHIQLLEAQLQREQSLESDGAVSGKKILETKNQLAEMQIQKKSLFAQLKLMGIEVKNQPGNEGISSTIGIYAPADGVLSEISVKNGEFVNPNQTIAQFVSTEHLHLELQLFEKDRPFVDEKDSISFTTNGSGKTFNAFVHLINPVLNTSTKAFNIHAHIDEAQEPFLNVGAYVQAVIYHKMPEGCYLPAEAVADEGEAHFIVINKDHQFKKMEVEILQKQKELIEIKCTPEILNQNIVQKGLKKILTKFETQEEEHSH